MTTEEERAKDLKVLMQAVADMPAAAKAINWDKWEEISGLERPPWAPPKDQPDMRDWLVEKEPPENATKAEPSHPTRRKTK